MKTTLPLVFLTLGLPAMAGQEVAPAVAASPEKNSGDWCEWLQNKPGLLYKDKENPVIQSFQIGGRFQWQAAYVDGEDVNGRDFNDTYDEYRRFRLETKTEFLKYFTAKVSLNMVEDTRFSGGEKTEWGYDSFDEAVLSFDIKKAFGAGSLDTLKLNYGRQKFVFTDEVRTSSKEIITVERSSIAGKVYNSGRPTGLTLDAAQDAWNVTVGLFSTQDEEFIDGWNEDFAYYASIGYEVSENLKVTWDNVYNDQEAEVNFLGYEWATALNATYEQDRFGFTGTLVLGENNGDGARGGNFHGLVAMPWYWIVADKLQAVAQYQYAGASEDEGIRVNSRYVRAEHSTGVDTNSGRGDKNHSLYAGLNYYLCGHNAKVMGGIEYNTLDTPDGNVDALSYLIAFRAFF